MPRRPALVLAIVRPPLLLIMQLAEEPDFSLKSIELHKQFHFAYSLFHNYFSYLPFLSLVARVVVPLQKDKS